MFFFDVLDNMSNKIMPRRGDTHHHVAVFMSQGKSKGIWKGFNG